MMYWFVWSSLFFDKDQKKAYKLVVYVHVYRLNTKKLKRKLRDDYTNDIIFFKLRYKQELKDYGTMSRIK